MKAASGSGIEDRKPALRRWLVFNTVGAFGLGVQLAVLAVLTEWTSCHYLLATAAAVEAAVIHNFLWHERWTWADRAAGSRGERRSRFYRFQLTNALAPMIGNLLLMRLFAGYGGLPPVFANLLAVAICSTFTFLAGDRLVFPVAAGARLRPKPDTLLRSKGLRDIIRIVREDL